MVEYSCVLVGPNLYKRDFFPQESDTLVRHTSTVADRFLYDNIQPRDTLIIISFSQAAVDLNVSPRFVRNSRHGGRPPVSDGYIRGEKARYNEEH